MQGYILIELNPARERLFKLLNPGWKIKRFISASTDSTNLTKDFDKTTEDYNLRCALLKHVRNLLLHLK